MKKLLTLIFLSVFCLNAINAKISWSLSEDGTLTISGTGDMEDYDYYSYPWVLQRESIKNVIIKNGITHIGNRAFYWCTNIISITIPNSVTSIGEEAFTSCAISSITIPNSLTTIGKYAFSNLTKLTSIIIPNSVTSIGYYAFGDCYSLTSITIPSSVTSIGAYAFYNCKSLKSVTLPNSVTSIGAHVFDACESLTSVTIPDGVTFINSYAFFGCTSLASIILPNSITSIGQFAFNGCKKLTSITIPNGVTSIGQFAFDDCDSLKYIIIPKSLGSIEDAAFYRCINLISIKVEDGNFYYDSRNDCNAIIRKKNNMLIYGCMNTIIPNSVTYIGNRAFVGCLGLTSINIPNSVTSIGGSAFYGCTGLKSITIPNSVKSIGDAAFGDCTGLETITIPNSVTNINYATFSGCVGLKKAIIEVNENLQIGKNVFHKSGLAELIMIGETLPKSADGYFANGLYETTTLYVPSSLYEEYRSTSPWSKFTNIMTLEHSDEANKIVSDAVIAKINAIGKVEYTDVCKGKIDDASKAYEALADVQKALVTNFDILITAKQTYNNLKKLATDKAMADAVVAKITAIGKVEYTDACKGKIDEASTAYNALTADQKVLVTNLDVLTTAKQTYDNLKVAADKLAADKAKADAVVAKISTIGKVEYTDACKKKIDNASNAYNALTDDQKALVSNLEVLTTAKQTYETLKADAEKLAANKAKANAVVAKINAIGTVEYTDACKGKIDEASTAYDALTDDQKALVTNLDVLTTAQQTYDDLKVASEKLAADKALFDKYKSEVKAIIEALVKEDDSDAVKDIIRQAISDIDALEYDVIISLDDNKVKVNSLVTSVNEAVEKQRVEDQQTTDINELQITNDELPVYDLNGKKITRSMLKSGLYIRNGKKLVVK